MRYTVKLNQKVYEVEIERAGGQAAVQTVQIPAPQAYAASAMAAQTAAPVSAAQAYAASAGAPFVPGAGALPVASAPGSTGEADTQVECPMPGKVLSIAASVGQRVSAGDCLVVIEAMKMENEIVAPRDGTVKQILVSQGTTVDTGDVLAVLL